MVDAKTNVATFIITWDTLNSTFAMVLKGPNGISVTIDVKPPLFPGDKPHVTVNPPIGIEATVGNSAGVATPAVFVIGSAAASIPTPIGGTLLVAPDSLEFVLLPAAGSVAPLTIPSEPSLCGVHAFGQVVEADPGAVLGYSFSQGIEIVLGI